MKNKILVLLLSPLVAFGQSLSIHEKFEAGDSISYTVITSGKSKKLEYFFSKSDKNLFAGKVIFDGKDGEFSFPSTGFEEQDFALSSGQMNIRKPAVKLFEPTMQVGMKWTNFFDSISPEFHAQVIQKVVVEKFEKVKLKFAEIDCFKIVTSDVYQVLTDKSEIVSGKGGSKIWVGVINNRMLIVKREYQNSFGAKLEQILNEPPKFSDAQKRLEKLKELYTGGLINESEYEQKKMEILKNF